MRRRPALAAASAAIAALLVTGCSPAAPLVDDPYTDIIESARGMAPLPPEARYDAAASRPPVDPNGTQVHPSLAPDDRTPEERIPEIYEHERIIVGVDQSLNLLGFRDTTTGELSGFEVALAKEISRDIFGDPDLVDFRYVDSTERISSLQEGRVDLVVRTMSVTPAREQAVDFSAPYLTARAGILVPSGSDIEDETDLAGRRVCVAADSTPEEIVRATAPDATLLLVRSWSDCLVALQQFQADAVVSDDAILAGINDQDPATVIVRRGLSTEFYAVGVAEDHEGLVRQVNSTLERLRADGTWQQLYNQWLETFLPGGTQPYARYAEETPEPGDDSGETTEEGR